MTLCVLSETSDGLRSKETESQHRWIPTIKSKREEFWQASLLVVAISSVGRKLLYILHLHWEKITFYISTANKVINLYISLIIVIHTLWKSQVVRYFKQAFHLRVWYLINCHCSLTGRPDSDAWTHLFLFSRSDCFETVCTRIMSSNVIHWKDGEQQRTCGDWSRIRLSTTRYPFMLSSRDAEYIRNDLSLGA
jgi:hypothetical protein